MNALFAARLNYHPWHITPAAAQELRVLAGTEINYPDDFITPRQAMRVVNGVAIIHVSGVLAGGMPGIWEKIGNTDYETLAAEIAAAADNTNVRAVLLLVSSPGGNCVGCTEIYDAVFALAAKKAVIAYTRSMMCSAAYYIASAASFIYASKTASVGCIGTIFTLTDASKGLLQMGVRVFQIASGDLKGGGTAIGYTDAQIADLERLVAEYFAAFSTDVRKKRNISDDAMRGQWFKADTAPPGLVDFIGTPIAAAQDVLALAGSTGSGSFSTPEGAWEDVFAAGKFQPSKHPRKAGGKGGGEFTTGGASGVKKSDPPAPVEPSEKSKRAKAAYVPTGRDVQRYSEEHNEAHFASDIGGTHIPGNGPTDVELDGANGKRHGIELKTITSGKRDRVDIKTAAQKRKSKWEKDTKGRMHTVVLDDRKVYNANGPGQHDFSKREMYYRRGYGSFRLDSMHKASGVEEIKKLVNTPTKQLPSLAKKR